MDPELASVDQTKGYPVIVCQEKWAFNNVLCMNMCTRASVYVLTYASIQRRYELGPAGLGS